VGKDPPVGVDIEVEMLIALLKRLAVPIPIIGLLAATLIRLKRQRQEKKAGKAGANAGENAGRATSES
jgi:hypothetical protein